MYTGRQTKHAPIHTHMHAHTHAHTTHAYTTHAYTTHTQHMHTQQTGSTHAYNSHIVWLILVVTLLYTGSKNLFYQTCLEAFCCAVYIDSEVISNQ